MRFARSAPAVRSGRWGSGNPEAKVASHLRIFGPVALIAGAALAAFIRLDAFTPAPELAPRVVLGRALLDLRSAPPEVVPPGGVAVVVHFPDTSRVLADTFRCVLNGKDVTSLLSVGGNGAAGSVFPLRVGENRLRVEVFGRGWWPGRWYEDAVEVTFRSRPLPPLDQG